MAARQITARLAGFGVPYTVDTHEDYVQRDAAFSRDGACLVTNSADKRLRVFSLSHDDLAEGNPHALEPQTTIDSPEQINAYALWPQWESSAGNTTYLLHSVLHQPMRLVNAVDGSVLARYPLYDAYQEEYRNVMSLAFLNNGAQFIAGARHRLALFDITRYNDAPIVEHVTAPPRRPRGMYKDARHIRGEFLALAVSPFSDLYAAGTETRKIALYDPAGRGECAALFSLQTSSPGTGVTSLAWSPCGRYLYAAERNSDAITVYDIRVAGCRLAVLRGRRAFTNQRLGFSVLPHDEAGQDHSIIAGGADGVVRVWNNPTSGEGVLDPSAEWRAHDGAVASTLVNPVAPSYIATSTGERHFPSYDSDSNSSDPDSGSSDSDSDGTDSENSDAHSAHNDADANNDVDADSIDVEANSNNSHTSASKQSSTPPAPDHWLKVWNI
ncbi:uncharacterized protein K452DRAFT_264458 [Aplosporella prunicola CBS 121167]|uniref:Anaphase-promoting complex subunit 4 WD40 domain-containing protein n=1 Tax=Aplosporella prunicola CBS 121167 TaxID=1176127 RepID=A0A6A6BRJ4_9PEZI|nr:uncharacterized protein K452DRAFT_264458 [Aplosporella prunicola CBS 121167]KAF2145437.1 hypothetical protein K452DRAFT_264458 [Aplosporella prunicola CBS 121167]